MMVDFLYVFRWWVLLLVFGIASLPLATIIFRQFFDRGYIFSKLIGISIVSYVVFLVSTLHIAPFTFFLIGGVLLFFLIINIVVSYKTSFLTEVKSYLGIFIFEELLFFVGVCFWAFIRGFNPDVHELEKFMDFGYVNSILRTTYFPPKDMWFTPLPINYYYFGHFVTAVLTKFSGIPSNITFNLMLATLFAFCFMCGFSLGGNLWYLLRTTKIKTSKQDSKNMYEDFLQKKHSLYVVISGILSAILLTFGGNLHILYAFFKSYGNDNPVPLWKLPFLLNSFPNAYWYPNATRFIYHTIHEFPIYSFVVSDLHGHVLDIPFVFLTVAILLCIFTSEMSNNQQQSIHTQQLLTKIYFWIKTNWYIPLLGFYLAIMYMTNAWDGLMYFGLSSVVIFLITKKKTRLSFFDPLFYENFLPKVFILFGCYYIVSLPFSLFFHVGEIAHGIGVLCSPKFLTDKQHIGPFLFEVNHCQHSPFWQLITLYGFFYIWAIPFGIFFLQKITKKKITLISFLKRHGSFATTQKSMTIHTSDLFIFILIIFSTLLIIIPEFFYLKDIYPEHYRANTMFKLVYQAFMLLSIVSGYSIVRFFIQIISLRRTLINKVMKTGYILVTISLLYLIAWLYPYFAITSYYNNLQTYKFLDGTAYLKSLYPTDYAAIQWINKHISGQPVMLEAQGDSYTDYARISANTGLPTVLGWTVHEWLWRGSYDVPAPRITDVETMYTTNDIQVLVPLLKKYHVEYVFIGDMERKKYNDVQIDKFNQVGKIIYKNGTTFIYQISS